MAIAFINGTSGGSFNQSSLTLTYTPTAGNQIVVGIDFDLGFSDPGTVTCTDNNSNSLTLNTSLANPSGNNTKMWQFYGVAISGATSYKFSWTGGNALFQGVLGEWSGVTGIGTKGTTAMGTGATQSITVSEVGGNSWIVVVFDDQNAGGTISTGTLREQGENSVDNIFLVDSTTATCAGTTTGNGSSIPWGAIALELLSRPIVPIVHELLLMDCGT